MGMNVRVNHASCMHGTPASSVCLFVEDVEEAALSGTHWST